MQDSVLIIVLCPKGALPANPGKGKVGTDEYDRFKADHNCCINYEGSAGSMETAGVLECYRESVELNKLRYVNYIGGWRFEILF